MAVHNNVGIGRSPLLEGTILSGASSVASELDLGRVYAFIVIRIPDCSNVASGSYLRLSIGDTDGDAMADHYRRSDGSQDLAPLPATGSFRMEYPVLGVRRVIPAVSIVTTGNVSMEVYGIETLIED